MAGIGLRLRSMLGRDSVAGDLAAYAYAGVVSAGPLVVSIVSILLIGVLSLERVPDPQFIAQFQVSITYLIATGLVLTGLIQLLLARFISDHLFERRSERILPNYTGATLVTTAVTGTLGLALALTVFRGETPLYRALMLMGFVIVSNIWISTIALASVKRYVAILAAFSAGYLGSVFASVQLSRHGVEGLLAGFVAGQLVLLVCLNAAMHRHHEAGEHIAFDMFERGRVLSAFVLIGLFFNLGIWTDKFIFWFGPTGQTVIGPLRASVIYDLPIFISYLCIIPGMAVLLLRLETDFVEHYGNYFKDIRTGATLGHIREMRNLMVRSARSILYDILKIQAVVTLLIFAFGDALLEALGISTLYLPLLRIHVVAAGLQVLLLACLNFFLYLDRRRTLLLLTAVFAALNGLLTWATLELGPDTYGYGFAGALLITVLLAVLALDRCFEHLEYETYMLQRS